MEENWFFVGIFNPKSRKRIEKITLQFDSHWLPNVNLLHICNLSSFTVNSVAVLSLGVQRSKLRQRSDRISTAILDKRARDDLKRARQCAVWELLFAWVILCIFVQEVADGELACATTWHNFALE